MACLAGAIAPVLATPRSVTTDCGLEQRQNSETQTDAQSSSSSVDQSCSALVCPACSLVLPNTRELTNHIRDHNSPRSSDGSAAEDECSCRVCGKVLSSASSLDRHILVHSGERPFKCRLCGLAFTTNGNMHRHIRTAHGGSSPNSCTDSEGSSDSERPVPKRRRLEEFNNNNNNNNNVAKRKSPECVEEQLQEGQRKHKSLLNNNSRGVQEMKNSQVDRQKTHSCPVCGRQDFATNSLLEAHLECTHPNYPAKCDTCNLNFSDHRVLNHHRSMGHHSDRSIDSPTRNLRNSVVGFEDLTFVDFSSGKFPAIARAVCEKSLHRPASGEVARFQCCKCLRAFPCRTALDSHETDCGNQNPLPRNSVDDQSTRNDFFAGLDLQNKAALAEAKEGKDLADIQSILSRTSEPILQNFSRSDASTPDNVIKIGSSIGSSGSSGTTSAETHDEEVQDAFSAEFRRMKLRGEFPCRLCTAVFPNLRALKGHNRAHMGVGPGTPYPCNMCPYTSTDKTALVRHLRSHNGDRPYECSLCNYAFTTKANCERHLRNRHAKLTREDVKRSIIYHPSEDPLNDSGEAPPRGVREDTRRILVYPTERDEIVQQRPSAASEGKSEIRVIDEAKLRQPNDIIARHTPQLNPFDTPEIFHRTPLIPQLDMIQRHSEGAAMMDIEKPQDLVAKPNFPKSSDDQDDNSSDESVSPLVSEAKPVMHQRLSDAPMDLGTSGGPESPGEEAPLDLSMDALDLSKKSKVNDIEPANNIANDDSHVTEKEIYNTTNHLLLTQALLKGGHNPQSTSLEAMYRNASLLYQNFGNFPGSIGAGLIQPYLFNPHLFNQEFVMKNRLQKELFRSLQHSSGGSLVEPQIPRTEFSSPFAQSKDASCHSASEDADYSPKLMSPKLSTKVSSSREKLENSPSSNSVKMVIKNGVLMPKQKQRRYRTERPFACEHCSARFTLRSNMERHVKQQHPQHWSQRQRGGHSTRGRPPANPPTLLQSLNQPVSQSISQHYSNILPKIDHTSSTQGYGKHSISDQVKYAILAQQLKGNKPEDNDSEEELVIDEEPLEEETSESRAQNDEQRPLSLLRGKLENRCDFTKENIMKQHVNDFSKDYLIQLQEQHLERLKRFEDSKNYAGENADDRSEKDAKEEPDEDLSEEQKKLDAEGQEDDDEEIEKGEDGVVDLASVSRLLDNASQQYQQFQPQYTSDEEEGLIASTSDGNNSGSDEKSDSGNSESITGKKKSAYSLAPNRVSCPYCHRKFPWTSSLRRHILTHTGQKPYKCTYCPLLFTTKSNCDRHLLRKHINAGTSSQSQSAGASSSPESSSTLTNSNAFAMRNVPERPYKCNQCPSSTFSTLGNLKKHLSSKHTTCGPSSRSHSPLSESQNSPNESLKQNDQSGYESPSSSVEEPARTSPTIPEDSIKATPNSSTSTETPQSSKTSPECGSTVSSCSSELPFKCHLCDGSFAERQDCLEHIKLDHRSEYELLLVKGALDMAAETETHPEEQQQHSQQHCDDGEGQRGKFPDYANRKVVCAFCMRRFWSAEDLRRHMRTHTGERPFTCDICRRKFTLKHSMLRHRKKHGSVGSSIYTGTSGDEEASPTPPMNNNNNNNNNNNTVKTQEMTSTPTSVPGDATPVRFGTHEKLSSLSGKLANLQNNNNNVEGADQGNDLISNLLGIRDRTIIDKVLQSTPDDAAKLLGIP
ncbi:ras-responsive element-binding protein 1 [Athalia rosae]|uniref:ras-responsive element-binding protein 1 n=1 Tax=Athalia rosae TaxID=37344 RepID=UPI002033867F|nr:ras-responsive element-binding protein 1 [Athalia rosae]XP_048506019.1 ras-responsive element-binding protein 1 [Athalia rosae]